MNKKKIIIICSICVIVIGCIIGIIVFNNNKTSDNTIENTTTNNVSNTDNSSNEELDSNSTAVINLDGSTDSKVEMGVVSVDVSSEETTTSSSDTTVTTPTTTTPASSDVDTSKHNLTYEEYCALTPSEKDDYYDSFSDPKDFVAWYNDAIAAYKEANPSIEITPGTTIDMNDYK